MYVINTCHDNLPEMAFIYKEKSVDVVVWGCIVHHNKVGIEYPGERNRFFVSTDDVYSHDGKSVTVQLEELKAYHSHREKYGSAPYRT